MRRRAARRRWKKGRAFASSVQRFSGKIMTAESIELYENAGSPVDLKAYEGMMQSKLIAAPEAGRWSQVRNVILKHGPDGLPHAHTCFNQLVLPPYTSVAQARDKLLYACRGTAGFHMT